MIGCDDAMFYLEDYVDGELTEEGMMEIHAHVSECAACAKELQLLEKVNAALLYDKEYHLPDTFVVACMEKINKLPHLPNNISVPRYNKTAAAFAAAAGIATLTLTAGLLFRKSALKLKKAS